MNLRCLLNHHNWMFSYNHGMPRGISMDDALKMFEEHKTFIVYVCSRCGAHSKVIDGKMVKLDSSEVETP